MTKLDLDPVTVRKARSLARKAGRPIVRLAHQHTTVSVERLKPGDVIVVPVGRFTGPAAVVDPGLSEHGHRPLVVTAGRQAKRLAMIDFPVPVEPVGRIRLPKKFEPRNPHMRKQVAQAIREAVADLPLSVTRPKLEKGPTDPAVMDQVAALRAKVRAHPCQSCPEREDHARWTERYFKLQRDTETLARRVERRTNTVAREFDRVCEVLDALKYLDGDRVTDRGRGLMRIYSDLDLVAAEALREGMWDDLSPSQLAAALSVLVYEARRPDESAPRVPGGPITATIDAMQRLWVELEQLEKDHRLAFLRAPDAGFAWTAYRWAEGDALDELLTRADLTAGDFVRQMKQLIDFAGQIADAAGDSPVRRTARAAIDLLRRGIVSPD